MRRRLQIGLSRRDAEPMRFKTTRDDAGLRSKQHYSEAHSFCLRGASMLQEIVLSVCTLVVPAACKEVHLQVTSEYGASLQMPFHCARQGQIQGQKWIAQHPGWRIERWSCPPPSLRAKLGI
jgi:hypothetical protein